MFCLVEFKDETLKPLIFEKLKPFKCKKVNILKNQKMEIKTLSEKFIEDDFVREYVYETWLKEWIQSKYQDFEKSCRMRGIEEKVFVYLKKITILISTAMRCLRE